MEANKRDERRRAEEENEREGEAAVEAAAAAASSKQSEAATSSSAAPAISVAAISSPSLSSSLVSLLHETLVIKEVPFNGLPPQEQQDILNEVSAHAQHSTAATQQRAIAHSEVCAVLNRFG